MACACSTRTCHWLNSVRNAPGLKCQGSARSVPWLRGTPPRVFFATMSFSGTLSPLFRMNGFYGGYRRSSSRVWIPKKSGFVEACWEGAPGVPVVYGREHPPPHFVYLHKLNELGLVLRQSLETGGL